VVLKNVNYPNEAVNDVVNEAVNGVVNGVVNEAAKESERRALRILAALLEDNSQTRAALAERLGISKSTLERDLAALKKQNKIKHIGSDKTGHWEVRGDKDGSQP